MNGVSELGGAITADHGAISVPSVLTELRRKRHPHPLHLLSFSNRKQGAEPAGKAAYVVPPRNRGAAGRNRRDIVNNSSIWATIINFHVLTPLSIQGACLL
jgi:hypothetical protein